MNAAAKALAETDWDGSILTFTLVRKRLWVFLLMVAVLTSAVGVVYVKTANRRLFTDLQTVYQTREQLDVEWGQLLLEQSTWAQQARVQSIASENLQMMTPLPKNTVVLQDRV